MRRTLSFAILHRAFTGGIFVIAGVFLGFLAYLYLAFGGTLTGDVQVELSPDLLASLQTQRFEAAIGRVERRRSMPDIPADLPDPYDAPVRAQ